MKRWYMAAALAATGLVQAAGGNAQELPRTPQAPRPPEPIPTAPALAGMPPNLVPGPISPYAAPPGPPDCLSLPASTPGAFMCEEPRPDTGVYFYAGALGYMRNRPDSVGVAFLDPTGNAETGVLPVRPFSPVLNTGGIDPKMAAGVQATLGYFFNEAGLELTGYYVFPTTANVTYASQGTAFVPFTNVPLGFEGNNGLFNQADVVRADLKTSLGSLAMNYRYHNVGVQELELVLGVRYLDLQETFRLFTDDDGVSRPLGPNGIDGPDRSRQATYTAAAYNRILAPQVGFEYNTFVYKGVGFGAHGTAAVGVNFVSTRTQLTRGDGLVGFNDTRGTQRISGYSEAGVHFDIYLLERCKVRGGYNGLWVVGVAEGTSQLDFNLANTRGTGNDNGDVFFHGPFLELEFLF